MYESKITLSSYTRILVARMSADMRRRQQARKALRIKQREEKASA